MVMIINFVLSIVIRHYTLFTFFKDPDFKFQGGNFILGPEQATF